MTPSLEDARALLVADAEKRLGASIRAALEAAGFDPPDNVCVTCRHAGGDHDLGNWCLVCPRPDAPRSFEGRVAAGWDYFGSMTDDEKWDLGVARYLEALGA